MSTTTRRLGLLGSLYFSQGLPYGFFTQALPVLMRRSGYSLRAIGLASLLALPWALKFLWAPLVDRHWAPALGRRRSWILPMQALTALVLLLLALRASDVALFAAVLVVNALTATQDIAADALAIDLLSPRERGIGNGVRVGGYRAGMIVGGGAILILFERSSSSVAFATMAGLVVLATVPILLARESAPRPSRSATERHFLARPGAARLLGLIVTYKVGDAFATGMLRPFLADRGLGLGEVGELLGTIGFVAGLLGAFAGGALVERLGRRCALVSFGVLQALAVAGYAVLASGEATWTGLAVVCGVEHFAGGMATAALFTCMMDWSRAESAATDYTVQASAVVIATGVASSVSGFSAQALGYRAHFVLATVLAGISVLVASSLFPAPAPGKAPRGVEVIRV